MYLLDKNICIYAMKNSFPALSGKLFQISPSEVFISAITVEELDYGSSKSKWGDRSRYAMDLFLSAYSVRPFTEGDARLFGQLRAVLAKSGMPIGAYDIQIAAQGISRGLIVVTHNTGEFERVPGIKLEDWTEE